MRDGWRDPVLARVVRYWRANGPQVEHDRGVRAVDPTLLRRRTGPTPMTGRSATAPRRRPRLRAGVRPRTAHRRAGCAGRPRAARFTRGRWRWPRSAARFLLGRRGERAPATDRSPACGPSREYQRQQRGLTERSITAQVRHVMAWRAFLRRRHRRLADAALPARRRLCRRLRPPLRPGDGRGHLARVSARCCGSSTRRGRRRADLSGSVAAPVLAGAARPPRALPWADVRRLLGAVDQSTRVGRRDFALLLLMATYGLGAGEVIAPHPRGHRLAGGHAPCHAPQDRRVGRAPAAAARRPRARPVPAAWAPAP